MNPVRLKLAQKTDLNSETTISVKVQNLAYVKDVAAHYTTDNVTWKNHSLAWTAPTFASYDIFTGTVNEQVKQLVIRYKVNGQTFWDNNDGRNYDFQSDLAFVGGNVILYKATARQGTQTPTTSWLEGEILVNNFGFSKDVGIVFTADGEANWTTVHGDLVQFTSDGKFSASGRIFTFKTPELNLNPAAKEFQFAVFYRDLASGKEFWDNNFGQNYHISRTDGSTLS